MLVIFTVISVVISKKVLEQYFLESKSFSKGEVLISEKESLTVVLNFWPLKNMDYPSDKLYQLYEQWELNVDFNLSFGVTEYLTIQEQVKLTNDDNEEPYIFHSSVGKIRFDKMFVKYGEAFKISANLIGVKSPYDAFLQIDFSDKIPYEKLPDVNFIVSSESNSYGVALNSWIDGKEVYINKVMGSSAFRFQPQKIIEMNSAKCQKEAYYECLHAKLILEDFSHCPRKCLAVSTSISKSVPLCQTEEEFICAYEIVKNLKTKSSCVPSCAQLNMEQILDYRENQDASDAKRNIFIRYSIPNTEMIVEEEYLVHDFIGMLGSIGGTLGMFIGFSFVGISSLIMKHLQYLILRLLKKKIITQKQIIEPKTIKVQPFQSTDREQIDALKTRISTLESKLDNMTKPIYERF